MSLSAAASLLTLPEIAAWQVAHPPAKAGQIVAALPALQRGAVWKVKQIEELWDSLLRRFPIGAFIIAPPNQALKQQAFKLQPADAALPAATHLLLDGQQRATGIALGFYNLWQHDIADAPSSLWLDLAPAPKSREAEWIFRVTTRAHPWGYKRSDPSSPLSAHQIRAALAAFRAANQCPDARPEEILLSQSWPWDAEAPVPLAMLIEAVGAHPHDLKAARGQAWANIQTLLPMFTALSSAKGENAQRGIGEARKAWQRQCQSVRDAFENPDHPLAHRLGEVLSRLQKLIDETYRIPALPLDLQDLGSPTHSDQKAVAAEEGDAAKKDPVELLFVRINSAGTPLSGEELIYSLLKAAWPEAADFIAKLEHKPALPSRIAMLCVRLVLGRRQRSGTGSKSTLPPVPDVDEFRRLVRNQNPQHPHFFTDLQKFIEHEANDLFTRTWQFLTGKPYALLPVLAVELAQKSPDVYFLLLCWLDRLQSRAVDEKTHQRTLGFLTALAWFAPNHSKACAMIWQDLQTLPDDQLANFFNATRFKKTLRRDARLNLRMIPLPSVEALELACKKHIIGGDPGSRSTIKQADSAIWSKWEWYESFAYRLIRADETVAQWAKWLSPEHGAQDEEETSSLDIVQQATAHFADRLWEARSLLLYAQREWLRKWYPAFDPSRPETMEDHNRPWDYDHILPQNFLRTEAGSSRRNIPQVIWDWCGSIGNLRAWPLEANRTDGDINPAKKLSELSDEEKRYQMKSPKDERSASFVQEDIDWPWWQKCVPLNGDGRIANQRYLALADYHEQRKALIMAIVLRFIELYRAWYDELKIGQLQ